MIRVNILVEGRTDEPVARRLLQHVGLEVGMVYGRKGKPHLLERSLVYNKAAQFEPWFILVDLDMDTQCASQALTQWLPNPTKGMRFRIAVQAIEAWLMADREGMAKFLAVAPSKLSHAIELDPNPKKQLINIARTSRNKNIREEMVPRQDSKAKFGPLYIPYLTEFTEQYWQPDEASKHSESLRRCINALSTLTTLEN